jgi:phage-related tail fiber protein
MAFPFVANLDIASRTKRGALRVGILAALLLGGTAIAHAASLVTWTSGQPLTATDLNGNFALLESEIAQVIPPGLVAPYAGTIAPSGWLVCDGSPVSRTTYAALFAAIGTSHGPGDGTASFNLPDYRGRFLRGVDQGAGVDPDAMARTAPRVGGSTGDAVGSVQAWATGLPVAGFATSTGGAHAHGVYGATYLGSGGSIGTFGPGTPFKLNNTITDTKGDHSHTIAGGDRETRPANAYVQYIIKH